MINLLEFLSDNKLIDMKLNVPQIRTKIFNYESLSDLDEDYLYDFIIDKNGNLKIGQGHYKLNNKEKYLYFAGRLKIKNNKIYYIDNDSGHFCPSKEEMLNIIKSLQKSEYFEDKIQYQFIDFIAL